MTTRPCPSSKVKQNVSSDPENTFISLRTRFCLPRSVKRKLLKNVFVFVFYYYYYWFTFLVLNKQTKSKKIFFFTLNENAIVYSHDPLFGGRLVGKVTFFLSFENVKKGAVVGGLEIWGGS